MDLVIRGGTVVDGTGAAPRRADVGVRGGRVAVVGDLSAVESARIVDAAGLLVAPGFVDIHSHSDFTLLVDPRAQSALYQGVTTEVVGNCGHGCAPIPDPRLVAGNIYGYTPEWSIDWTTMAGYLDRLDTARPAVNVATLVPNGNLRLAALGLADRAATPTEVETMSRLLTECLEAGAWGFSTGLEYPGERSAGEAELVALCRVAARAGTLYATHTRNRDARAVEAIEEAVRVAAAAGARLQVSHLIPRRGGPADARERAVEVVDRARADGLDVAFDSHTRLHGITNLSAALPPGALAGGTAEIAGRLADPAVRAELKRHESIITSFGMGGWERVYLFESGGRPDLVGRSFAELAEGGDPLDAVLDLLLADVADIHRPMVLCESYTEAELRDTFAHPLCTVGSDATTLAVDGPLAGSTFLGAYTWAAWFWRRFVTELRLFTPEAAVVKLAAEPADRLGLPGRGRLVPGAHADVIAFDSAQFGERGTLREPNRLAAGMRHVVVNGTVSMEHGALTAERGGHVLRR